MSNKKQKKLDNTRLSKPKRDKKGRILPGYTGNPKGKPKGAISVVSAIKAKLQECPEGKQKTYLHYLVEKIMKKAVIDDDVSMIKDIIDRVDGKATQMIEFKDRDELEDIKGKVNSFFKTNDKKKKKRS
jgi:hypothetical protein